MLDRSGVTLERGKASFPPSDVTPEPSIEPWIQGKALSLLPKRRRIDTERRPIGGKELSLLPE
jgi:hypothetical protein